MTALPQSTRRKLSLLHLAQELQNVSKACRNMGITATPSISNYGTVLSPENPEIIQ